MIARDAQCGDPGRRAEALMPPEQGATLCCTEHMVVIEDSLCGGRGPHMDDQTALQTRFSHTSFASSRATQVVVGVTIIFLR